MPAETYFEGRNHRRHGIKRVHYCGNTPFFDASRNAITLRC